MAFNIGLVFGQLFVFALIGVFAYIVITREFGGTEGLREAMDEII